MIAKTKKQVSSPSSSSFPDSVGSISSFIPWSVISQCLTWFVHSTLLSFLCFGLNLLHIVASFMWLLVPLYGRCCITCMSALVWVNFMFWVVRICGVYVYFLLFFLISFGCWLIYMLVMNMNGFDHFDLFKLVFWLEVSERRLHLHARGFSVSVLFVHCPFELCVWFVEWMYKTQNIKICNKFCENWAWPPTHLFVQGTFTVSLHIALCIISRMIYTWSMFYG